MSRGNLKATLLSEENVENCEPITSDLTLLCIKKCNCTCHTALFSATYLYLQRNDVPLN